MNTVVDSSTRFVANSGPYHEIGEVNDLYVPRAINRTKLILNHKLSSYDFPVVTIFFLEKTSFASNIISFLLSFRCSVQNRALLRLFLSKNVFLKRKAIAVSFIRYYDVRSSIWDYIAQNSNTLNVFIIIVNVFLRTIFL